MPLAYSASGAGGPAPAPSCSTGTAPRSVLAGQSTSALAGPSGTSAQAAAALGAAPPVHQQHHHSATPLSDALLLALRQRPSTRLFRALFQYIPIRDSPNENPQLELPLQAGDYVLVHGEMDEDQFYQGETLDGQTGLVPSNYVERVNEQQLLLNCSRAPSPSFPLNGQTGLVPSNYVERVNEQQLLLNCSRAPSPSFPLSVPAHLTQIQHDFSTTDSNVPLPDSVCPYPPVDVAKVTVQEIKQTDTPRVNAVDMLNTGRELRFVL
uniref:SH3 domain-containing protein n=1 Tax=Ascaris lumbricoides TaxID=6252 RepID=A0A0M3IJN9_ASCLU